MANTIKISKSKNLIFKKLSFLYLVFILFLFLSSPGKFVEHYSHLVPAQDELNENLRQQLENFEALSDEHQQIKSLSNETLQDIEALQLDYQRFSESEKVSGEKLKESHFANDLLVKAQAGQDLKQSLERFVKGFKDLSGIDLSPKLLSPVDFSDQKHDALDFFFQDTPNGVILSILQHFRTTILVHSLQFLKGVGPSLNEPKILSTDQLDLIQNFKKSLAPGEKLLFKVKSEEQANALKAWINGEELNPSAQDSSFAYYEYLPETTGYYTLDFLYQGRQYHHNFKVNKPGFKIEKDRSTFIAQVGEKQSITLNTNYLPFPEVNFNSEHADLSYENGILELTPYHAGAFTIYMEKAGEVLDSISLYAKDVNIVDVALMDIAGKENVIRESIRLEAINPFWQVVNFKLKITYPNGKQRILHNATRFLGPDLKESIERAPEGSLFAFQGIKVIGKNGHSYRDGRTIISRK